MHDTVELFGSEIAEAPIRDGLSGEESDVSEEDGRKIMFIGFLLLKLHPIQVAHLARAFLDTACTLSAPLTFSIGMVRKN